METEKKKAIIIGAGPAGLTAAWEMLKRTDILPVILEKSKETGGISKTINYKGNRMDIGGHRFFSTSERVMSWWNNIMPAQEEGDSSDKVMLVRKRLSHVYFLRKFFTYPVTLSMETLRKLGIFRTIAILFSYLKAQLFPRKTERSLEDIIINQFGKTFYETFFKDNTEKIWGVPAYEIPAAQKDEITNHTEQFLYPKYGPGQLWEEVTRQIQEMGGIIYLQHEVKYIHTEYDGVTSVTAVNCANGEALHLKADYFISTMPVKELIAGIAGPVPPKVKEIAAALPYRHLITVGILLKRLSYQDKHTGEWKALKLDDIWIDIREKGVMTARLLLFNNWSPFMVKDPDTVWVGMEFYCNQSDEFRKLPDAEIEALAIREFEKMGLATAANVLDSTVLRVKRAYPDWFRAAEHFEKVRAYTDTLENLFLIGRNGMHKYDTEDHSVLTAMVAVDNISAGIKSKENIWAATTKQEEQHENSTLIAIPESQFFLSFRNFLLYHSFNRALLWIAGFSILLQFIVFKYMYPHAGFIDGDSYVYLESAYLNLNINTYPVGYSKFLRIFSTFTHSDLMLVLFQYLLLQSSALYFFFTLRYFYKPGKLVSILLFVCLAGNPVFLYMSNYISSDALFLSLSLLWFTTLLWMLQRPTGQLIAIHALLLLLAFTVRYNALFYPLIATLAFILSRQRVFVKVIGITASFLVIAGFMYHTSNQYNRLTGIRQFSPFSGWQMANNALYAYRYVKDKKDKPLPNRFKELDGLVRSYFDSASDVSKHPEELLQANTWYMWDPKSPLQQYMANKFRTDSSASGLKRWATVGPLYADYGAYLIRQYPKEFAEYYLMPNALKYYVPPVEFLDTYNMGKDSVAPIAEFWFGYKTRKVSTIFKDLKVSVLNFYPVTAAVFNILFVLGMIGFIVLKGIKEYPVLSLALLLVTSLWLVNFGFSVFAASIALRFQLFPLLVSFAFGLLLIEYVWKAATTPEKSI